MFLGLGLGLGRLDRGGEGHVLVAVGVEALRVHDREQLRSSDRMHDRHEGRATWLGFGFGFVSGSGQGQGQG